MVNDFARRRPSKISLYRRIQSTPALKYTAYILALLLLVPIISFISSRGFLDISKVTIKPVSGYELNHVDTKELKGKILGQKEKNYFRIDLEILEKEVVRDDPFVQSAFFTKSFPNRLVVEITPRTPYIIAQLNTTECNLIDEKGFVLAKEPFVPQEECKSVVDRYKVPVLKMSDSKIPFDVNSQSAFFTVKDIANLRKVFSEYNIIPIRYELKNGVLYSYLDDGNYIVTSTNQDITTQLSRFVVVIGEIEERGIEFSMLDLRYKRPVIISK